MLNVIVDDKFKRKYRGSPVRLRGWDYGSNALYYISICIKDRNHYFGEIVESQNAASLPGMLEHNAFLRKAIIGEIAHNNWMDIPDHFPFVELDQFVVMPNQVHGLFV